MATKNIIFPDCSSQTVNKQQIRMNCLILASLDERVYRVFDEAEAYYHWVMDHSPAAVKKMKGLDKEHDND